MEKQFPKNVRQIGNVSDSPKIYVEDYVDTFFDQICEADIQSPAAAFLIGHQVTIEDQPCVYISGAVQVDELLMRDDKPVIDDEVLKKIREEKEKYFHDGEIIGWFLAIPGQKAETNENIIKIHEKTFPKTNTLFVIRDTDAKEEMFFAYKYHDLLQIGGHYIYYEKNPDMQNYMITRRRQNGVTPSEAVEDQAAKNFRSVVRDRMNQNTRKKTNRLSAVTTTLVVMIAVVIGISMVNNYDKMKSVQDSLALLSQAVAEKETLKKGSENVNGAAGEEQLAENENQEEGQPQADWNSDGENENPVEDTSGGAESDGQEETRTDSTIMQEESVEASAGAERVLNDEDFYIVQKGDTLDSISKKMYGDVSHVESICKMNGLKDGNLIFIGQKILLP